MAKYVDSFKGNFDKFIVYIEKSILNGSSTASLEYKYENEIKGVRCCVQVYERYSAIGGNRVSLNVTILGNDENIEIVAITSGGSQALFFKINTWGEETFLDKLIEAVEKYKSKYE